MSLRTVPRTVASNALYRSPLCLSVRPQSRFPIRTCAFSTTTPLNRRVKVSNLDELESSDVKRPKKRVRLQSDSWFDLPPEWEARADAVVRALDREARLRGARVWRTKVTDEHREMERILKEDYKRRYKQAERNWVKFMVAMPILIVTSYHLFQRLVMGKEQKVFPKAKPDQGAEGSSES